MNLFCKNSICILGILFISLSSFRNFSIQTNDDPLLGWDKSVLKQANTAASVTYLSAEEKKLIFYTNLCRLQPKLFCQTVLADYLKNNPDMSVDQATLAKLKSQLINETPCGTLAPDKQLCTIAHNFAQKMGQEGERGHADFQNRINPVLNRYNRVGENCDYGNTQAIDAFMHLLIDKSDPVNLMHRKNLLDPKFTAVGISGQPHTKYKWNYVMDFGGQG